LQQSKRIKKKKFKSPKKSAAKSDNKFTKANGSSTKAVTNPISQIGNIDEKQPQQ
jgi:hypothetical protein